MTHPSRRRSVKCISWPGLAHPNLNSLSRAPSSRISERPSLFAMLVPPPRSNLLSFSPRSSLPSGLAHFLRSPLRRRPTKSSRVSVVLMMKRRRKVAHYTFDVDSRGKSHRDVTGRGHEGRGKNAHDPRGREKSARPRLPLREIREIPREGETRGVCQYYNFIDTSLALSLSLSRRISFILSPSLPRGGIFCSRDRKRENRCSLLRTFFSPFLFCFLLSFFFFL